MGVYYSREDAKYRYTEGIPKVIDGLNKLKRMERIIKNGEHVSDEFPLINKEKTILKLRLGSSVSKDFVLIDPNNSESVRSGLKRLVRNTVYAIEEVTEREGLLEQWIESVKSRKTTKSFKEFTNGVYE